MTHATKIGLTLKPCALCHREFTIDKLWPVINTGHCCDACIDLLREQDS